MSSAASPPRFDVPEASIAFLSASTAAGNRNSNVAVKARSCPQCAHDTLFFAAEQAAVVMSGRVPRRQFRVVTYCRTPSCGFLAATSGRFTLT